MFESDVLCSKVSRRDFLQAGFVAGAAWSAPALANEDTPRPVAIRAITRGPKHHWFGYYDKLQFDPTSRYALGMEVDFEHRAPLPNDEITVGMVDLADGDRWIELGKTTAWCWQQGCMLQWIPGSKTQIVWNDREKDRYVCRMLDVATGESRTLPSTIFALAPDGRTAITTDYRRVKDMRPGYGYTGLPDPCADDLAPRDSGIWRVDLATGKSELIVSIAEVAGLGTIPNAAPEAKHYVYHLLFNPDGTRFVFLHRWRYPDRKRLTRMLTANPDGSDLRVIDDNGLTSHFIWRDPWHLLAWSQQPHVGKGFFLFEDRQGGYINVVGQDSMQQDGHVSYLPDSNWILNDTYPDSARMQKVYLYHVPTGRMQRLARLPSPPEYVGEWRCDTHPRHSPDGRLIVVDSPQAGAGRQMHLIDVSELVSPL